MKVVLTGAAGQLGQALIDSTPAGITLTACRAAVFRQQPDWVPNAGA